MPFQLAKYIILSGALFYASIVSAIPPTYTFQTGLGFDDVGDDSDSFIYVTGSGLFSKGLSRNRIVDFRAEVSSYEYSDEDNRSFEEIFLEGIYSYTPRAGFQVPTYSLGLRHIEEFGDSSDFDSSTTTLLGFVTYRLDDRTTLLGGLQFSERDSSDDSSTSSYFITADYRLNEKWILYSTLNLADEDIDAGSSSGSSAATPGAAVRSANFASHHTPSEGGGAAISDESDNTFFTIAGSYIWTPVDTLELSLVHQKYDTSSGTIDGNIYSINFFHRF